VLVSPFLTHGPRSVANEPRFQVRVTAFIIRSVLASSSSAGENLGLLIGDEVLFGVGFFGLLYSAYTLVLDRWVSSSPLLPS
jgi:hypothetical protein